MRFDINKFKGEAVKTQSFRYANRLKELKAQGRSTDGIASAVEGAVLNIHRYESQSFVIYGEPQSGKTEMMIALTARLLDEGHKVIILLLNDSVQLLTQNLARFQHSGLDPAPKNFSAIIDPNVVIGDNNWVIFCKKNSKDLQKLLAKIDRVREKVIIDDEADYATPNVKVNKQEQTKINELVSKLIGKDGIYIGVTATPARLDLNKTFDNDNEKWIDFLPHPLYTGKDVFFPTKQEGIQDLSDLKFRLIPLPEDHDEPKYLRTALLSFLINVAHLNLYGDLDDSNYSMLIHTSGKKVDHSEDYKQVVKLIGILKDENHHKFKDAVYQLWLLAQERYPGHEDELTQYVCTNIGRNNIVVMNSDTEKNADEYKSATTPSALFTIAIGGNIVSRGVTFDNLLSMFFTRDVKHKIQQDTYIQRARMFGTRGSYLDHFELHIPAHLYLDWQKCFVFHRLALAAIHAGEGSPVWLEDTRISAAASSSVNKAAVDLDSGEMSFTIFDYDSKIDEIISEDMQPTDKILTLRELLGEGAFPKYVQDFINDFSPDGEESTAIHRTTQISDDYSDADVENIRRVKGFMNAGSLERAKFPNAIHHIKVFKNSSNKARVFYKYTPEVGKIRFLKRRTRAKA